MSDCDQEIAERASAMESSDDKFISCRAHKLVLEDNSEFSIGEYDAGDASSHSFSRIQLVSDGAGRKDREQPKGRYQDGAWTRSRAA